MTLGVITENGWPSCDIQDCDTSTIPGSNISIPIQIGEPNTILKAFLAALNEFIEPFNVDPRTHPYVDEGGWTPTNSVATSNHLGATATDFNFEDHPMGPEANDPAAGWKGSSLIPGDEVPAVRELLDYCEGLVFWGNDWTTPKDSMHFQMGYGTYDGGNTGDAWNPSMHSDPKCMDFIGRKIDRATMKLLWVPSWKQTPPPAPAPTPTPVVTSPAAATVLAAAIGSTVDFAMSILPAVSSGLIASECTNVNRVAMWLAEEGEESASFTATVEIGTIDGTTYQGRTWEQITGLADYRAFSQWAFDHKVPGVTSPTYFVDNPAALGDPQYESIGAAWYWTVARPQINSLADAGDVEGVTRAINGGLNGIDDRTRRWNLALAQGDALLTLIQQPTTGGALMALTDDEQQELLTKVREIHDQLGPKLPGWGEQASVGVNPDGSEMYLREGIAALIRTVDALSAKAGISTVNNVEVCQIKSWLAQAPATTAYSPAPRAVQ